MPTCLVLQPNGKWATYSKVTDTMTTFDMTAEEAVGWEMERLIGYPGGDKAAKRALLEEIRVVRETGQAWDWGYTWMEAIAWTLFYNGEDAPIVQQARDAGALSEDVYAEALAFARRAKKEAEETEER